MSTMEGKKVPQVTFRTRQGDKWVDVTSSTMNDIDELVVTRSVVGNLFDKMDLRIV